MDIETHIMLCSNLSSPGQVKRELDALRAEVVDIIGICNERNVGIPWIGRWWSISQQGYALILKALVR